MSAGSDTSTLSKQVVGSPDTFRTAAGLYIVEVEV